MTKEKPKLSNQNIFKFQLYRDLIKRFFDLLFSVIAIVILAIPMIIIATLIKTSSPSEPVLFKQTRIGKNNIPFTIYKFRTMVGTAPHQLSTEEFAHPEEYVTSLGQKLRRTSLDELPQLFNVVKGEMSIIGPRPLIPNETIVLKMRTELGATKVLPGITGLAQINGRDDLIGSKKAQIDASYARNVNMFLDLIILIRTVVDVISGRGINGGKSKS
ncbi:sugar transferase [Limosilactobacillus agrestimuris]|uniref:sugar transferase n=1 Tax=Limosilactobacillus agrestimuris TaxID=2941331 RepID=UPI0020407431|nr:sugar transferase [Limosilactobacillus agrestimuris]